LKWYKNVKSAKRKFFHILKGEGGLKPCEGEKGAGERGNPRGERGAGGSKQTFIRIWLEYSNWRRRKQSKEEKEKIRYPRHLIKANMYTWSIYN
jgi:hypothetical protein